MMTQIFADPNPRQHSRLTLDDAIAQHEQGLLTAAGLIFHAVKIYRPAGQTLAVSVKDFCNRLKLARSTFYSALAKLRTLNDWGKLGFSWISQSQLLLWIPKTTEKSEGNESTPDTEVAPIATQPVLTQKLAEETNEMTRTQDENCDSQQDFRMSSVLPEILDNPPEILDNPPEILDNPPEILDNPPEILDRSCPKRPPGRGFGGSSNQYQIFIKSLSDDRREKFLNFVVEEVKNWKRPINDVHDFLASQNKGGENRWEIYYQNFLVKERVRPSRVLGSAPLRGSLRDRITEEQAEREARRQRAEKAYAKRVRTTEERQ